MTEIVFQAPTSAEVPGPGPARRADLVEVSHALESMRDAGFDLTAAVGEPIDNSIQASASIINVRTIRSKDNKTIEAVAFADNGTGIAPDGLAHALKMGYSTRYGDRKGLGRFGVGLKLASISIARRLEIISRPVGSDKYYRAYLDLDEVSAGEQEYIEATEVSGWPADLRDLMAELPSPSSKGRKPASAGGPDFDRGTLVIWRKVDRIKRGGAYGTGPDESEADIRKFIARAYRKTLATGVQISFNGKVITLHDPLFLMDNPRIASRYKHRETIPKGDEIDSGDIDVEGHKVHVTVALVPKEFRPEEGAGGEKDDEGKDIREFQINRDTEGCLSILRNGREIYYDIVPRMFPEGVQRRDRYVAVEVSFPAELDEYFQVRHVKRGAEPVSKLRESLRNWLQRPIVLARKKIREHWDAAESAKPKEIQPHEQAHRASRTVEQSWPAGRAGQDLTPEESQETIEQLIIDVLGEEIVSSEPERAEELRRTIDSGRLSLADGRWPGNDLLDITHVNDGKAVTVLNRRHPFLSTFYDPITNLAESRAAALDPAGMVDLARRTEIAFDFLFLAYTKAENLGDPQHAGLFNELRSRWGLYLHNLAQAWNDGKE